MVTSSLIRKNTNCFGEGMGAHVSRTTPLPKEVEAERIALFPDELPMRVRNPDRLDIKLLQEIHRKTRAALRQIKLDLKAQGYAFEDSDAAEEEYEFIVKDTAEFLFDSVL